MFALLDAGELRCSHLSGNGAVLARPTPVGGFKSEVSANRFAVLYVTFDELRRDSHDHGGFPFAGMTHFRLLEITPRFVRLGVFPIGGEEQQQIAALAVTLTKFEDCLFAGNTVSAVPVEEHDVLKP